MQVILHHDVEKYLNRMNEADRSRVKDALKGLKKEPPEGNIRPITGQQGHFRTRVGSYRILWRIEDNAVLVTHVEPRGQAYKKKNKER